LDYDVSLHKVVELVDVIPMSPRSSKTESDAQVCCFRFGVFTTFRGLEISGVATWLPSVSVQIFVQK
jgi:hypothetical protein